MKSRMEGFVPASFRNCCTNDSKLQTSCKLFAISLNRVCQSITSGKPKAFSVRSLV